MPIPILMDCDPGHDDAIALVMAHRSPDVDLLGVTTVCGNAEIEKTTQNTLRILQFIGAEDTQVAQGSWRPLARPLRLGTADGPSGLEGSPYLPAASMPLQPMHAVDFLAAKLRAAPDPVTLVPTGPLTNIAFLILKHPDVLAKIREVVLMGGVFYRPNEYFTPTEFNIFCDPEAAQIVIDSGLKVTMVGLDVTMKVLVEAEQFAELRKIDTPLGRVVLDWLAFYEKLHRGTMGVGGALHDPLALAAVIDPTLLETKHVHIAVDCRGTHMLGATVADFWGERGLAPNVHIATGVDSDRFFAMLYSLLRD